MLLSSHLLNEVQLIADDLVVIGHGKIVAEGEMSQLLTRPGSVVDSMTRSQLVDALTAAGVPVTQRRDGSFDAEADPVQVGNLAQQAGVALVLLRPADSSLEEMFLKLTADTAREAVPSVAPAAVPGRTL